MELNNARGTKDYLPEEMIVLNDIMANLRQKFESAGFNPLTTPAIERMDILAAKYAGGSEILKETFQFEDQGGRKLGLRYDLTVPFARIMGQNPQLKLPFKRYQMEKVYRDGPVSMGRYREFWQCDIDLVGAKSMKAEAELLSIAESFFKSYDFKPILRVNNRKIMNAILDKFSIDNKDPVIMILDKFFKLPKEELINEMKELSYDEKESKDVIDTFTKFSKLSSNEEKLKFIEDFAGENDGIREMKELLSLADAYGLDSLEFSPILARGLSYYTSSVFEVVLDGNKIQTSVCGGGRYDKMIGDFLESKETYPAVGLSFGVSRIYDALLSDNKVKTKKSVTQILAISIGQDLETIIIVKELRERGINVEVDLMDRKMNKNMSYADTLGIPYVIIIGENEVKLKKVTLKNLETGKQEELTIEQVADKFKNS